jgi:hypothetical protein
MLPRDGMKYSIPAFRLFQASAYFPKQGFSSAMGRVSCGTAERVLRPRRCDFCWRALTGGDRDRIRRTLARPISQSCGPEAKETRLPKRGPPAPGPSGRSFVSFGGSSASPFPGKKSEGWQFRQGVAQRAGSTKARQKRSYPEAARQGSRRPADGAILREVFGIPLTLGIPDVKGLGV